MRQERRACAGQGEGRPRSARPVGFAWGMFLALILSPAFLAAQSAPGEREVVALRFEGVRSFREEELRTAIETRESYCKVPPPLSWAICSTFNLGREREYLDDPITLEADAIRLRLFYFQRGFREAKVDVATVPKDDGIEVVFRIEEGRPVRVVALEVEGAAGFLPDDIAEHLPLRSGDPLDLIAVEAARDSLISALRNRGYPRADALIDQISIPAGSLEATVRLMVIPGTLARFGEVEITGAQRVSESVIRRMLTFDEGGVYSQDALLTSQSNLYGLNVFQNVSIRPMDDPEVDSIIPVRIQVNEGNIHRIRVGAGANSLDCINAQGLWTSRNFLGGARRLEVRGAISNVLSEQLGGTTLCQQARKDSLYAQLTYAISADFAQPWFFGPRNTLGLGIFAERQSLPDVFVRVARGGSFTLTRMISSRTSLMLGFRPERTRMQTEGNLIFCTSFLACAVDQAEALGRDYWLTPITLSFARDRTNSIFHPSRGYVLRVDAEYAPEAIGSDFAYARLVGDLSTYRSIANGVILAARGRAGRAWSITAPGGVEEFGLYPQKRFFSGGANSVRGFAQYRLGPKVLTVDAAKVLAGDTIGQRVPCTMESINDGSCSAEGLPADRFDPRPVGGEAVLEGSLELRFPLYGDKWQGAAFVDVGQVWQDGAEIRLDDIVVTPGFGIRYNSPIGPIRVDIGYNGVGSERLPVVTTRVRQATDGAGKPLFDADGRPVLENTTTLRTLDPVSWNPRRSFLDRLQLHFSIGQAF